MPDLEFQIVRDPVTGIYNQIPIKNEEDLVDIDDLSHVIKKDVQLDKTVVKLNKKL